MEELQKLANQCNFGDHLKEALRDLVCGLRREAMQKKLLTVETLTFQKVYETEVTEKQAS